MRRLCTPWFDRGAELARAWPPPSGAMLEEALRDVRARDRHGDALHFVVATIFAFFAALDQAPNSVATAMLLAVALARFAFFPVLLTPIFRWPPFWLGLAWVAWSALSALWSPGGSHALATLAPHRALLALIGLFPVVSRAPVSGLGFASSHARVLAWALVAAVGLNASVQIFQRVGWIAPPGGPTWRPSGIVAIPSVAAINGGIAILLALSMLVHAGRIARIALVGLIGLAAAGLVLSSSRHPALSLMPALALLPTLLVIAGHARPWAMARAALVLLGVAVLALLLFGREFVGYLKSAGSDTTRLLQGERWFSSIHLRLFWWRLGIEEWLAHPIRGGGVGSFRRFVAEHADTAAFMAKSGISREEVLQLHPHSSYVRALAETGIVGFLAFTGAIAACVRAGLSQIARDPLIAGATSAAVFVALATAGECVELMNVAYAPTVVAIAIAALPRGEAPARARRAV